MVSSNVSIALSSARLPAASSGISRESGSLPALFSGRPSPEQAGLQRNMPRYQYARAVRLPIIASRRNARATGANAKPGCGRQTAAIEALLGIGVGKEWQQERYAFIALLRFAGETAFSRSIGEEDAAAWLARFRDTTPARAADDLARIRQTLREVFFNLPPAARQRQWDTLPQTTRQDINMMVAITEAASSARMAKGDPLDSCTYNEQRESRIYQRVADALQRAPNDRLGFWETSYRMALAQFLREYDAPHNAYFSDRVEVLPSDVRNFIDGIIGASLAGQPDGVHLSDPVYTERRSRDLEATLFQLWCGAPCTANEIHQPSLLDMRATFEDELGAEQAESLLLQDMFAPPAQTAGHLPAQLQAMPGRIHHNGLSLCNADGCSIDALVARLDRELPEFSGLPQAVKQRLVKRKLILLQENPDYPIGHPFQSMATILMRLSDRPPDNRYVRYSTPLALGQAWEACNLGWIEKRASALAPELLAALHNAGASGLAVSGLGWYRNLWENAIIAPLKNHPAVQTADASDRNALWTWLQRRAPGWQLDSMHWDSMPARQYADTVTGVAEILYQLHRSRFPLFHMSDSWAGVTHTRFDPLLDHLPYNIRQALTDVAKRLDIAALQQERILADDWIGTVRRLLERAEYARALVLQPPPSFSPGVEAYLELRNAGVAHVQMQMKLSTVIAPNDFDPGGRQRRAIYPAFVSLMGNAHMKYRLLLPGGVLLQPHSVIEATLAAYRRSLPDRPWVRGKAYSMLREGGYPILPALLRTAIEAIVAPMRENAIPMPATGQDLIARFAEALPDIGLLPQLKSSIRNSKNRGESIYAMMLVRNAGAAMALGSALDAAAPDIFRRLAALCTPRAARTIGTQLLRTAPTARLLRLQGNQNRRAFRSPESYLRHATPPAAQQGCAADRPEVQDIAYLWKKIGTTLHPDASPEQLGTRYQLFQLQAANVQMRSLMAESGPPVQDGPAGGFLDLAGIDACTLCNGKPLGRHATVIDASDWLLKTGDGKMRNIDRLLSRHVTVTIEESALQAWQADPAARYDPLELLRRFYSRSEQCRKLLNWHDDHASCGQNIAIVIAASPDADLRQPQIPAQTAGTPGNRNRTLVNLPCMAQELPVIMDEQRFSRQTLAQALIERLVAAITNMPAPDHVAEERGVNIWLANRILLQDGEPGSPRVNAAVYSGDNQALPLRNDAVRYAAEMEDQYMEHLGMLSPLPHHGMHQGGALAKRPTVAAVTDVLAQLDYRRILREEQGSDAISLPEQTQAGYDAEFALFRTHFDKRFRLDFSASATEQAERGTAMQFLFDRHRGSSLFRTLFDRYQSQVAGIWTIFPHGYQDGQPRANHRLIPAPGIIDACTENKLYQGLFDMQPAHMNAGAMPDTNAGTDIAHARPSEAYARTLLPLNQHRRLLDGVVAVLCGNTEPVDDTCMHRGPAVWLSDTILWQSGWQVNRRLAAALVPFEDNLQLARLKALSGANRRAARAEDRAILAWLEE